jgi:hypothetical protein
MHSSRKLTQALLALCALVVMGTSALAADPGLSFPATSEVSDQKAGSVLYFTLYASSASMPNRQNTRFNITNTSNTASAFVHLYFIDGSTCNIANRYICLTPNQTTTFLASDQDPGTIGYMVAVAVDGVTGCPISFNFLIGTYSLKLETNHQANLGADAFSALYQGTLAGCDGNSVTATLVFNGTTGYNRAPRTLAATNIPSLLDSNNTVIAVARVGGNFLSGAGSIGTIFGLIFNDVEVPHSWSSTRGCHFLAQLNNTFPFTVPRFTDVIPSGHTGWLKFFNADNDFGLLGVMVNYNPNGATGSDAFNGGHNLHKLTLAGSGTSSAAANNPNIIVPVFPPGC